MVFVCLHSNNFVAIRICNIENLLLNIISDRTFEQLLAILRNKDYMHFKTVFLSVMTVISVIHTSPQNIDISLELLLYNNSSEISTKGVHVWNR